MNIFVLHSSPRISAESLCDKHVVKMSVEYGQILSTVHHILGSPIASRLYRPTHRHHPCVVWAAAHPDHYEWLLTLADWTWVEYYSRYGRRHATSERLGTFLNGVRPHKDASRGYAPECPPPLCLPDAYKVTGPSPWWNAIASYRAYYVHDKSAFAAWRKTRPAPAWYTKEILRLSKIPLDIAS